jgi:predicted phosphodiesterase
MCAKLHSTQESRPERRSVWALALLVAWSASLAVSCASTQPALELDLPVTQPVPDAEALAGWLGTEPGSSAQPRAFFIQMADPQLGMSGKPLFLTVIGTSWKDDNFAVDAKLFETAIAHANELAPSFVVICGDLVNRAGHPGQIAEFRRITEQLDHSIPLYLVAGNHDVENKPSAESLTAYRATFGSDWYSFRNGDVYGIVLNSQLIDAPDRVPLEAEKQLAWLRDELVQAEASGARHLLVFQHHPYFLTSASEEDQYFNIAGETRAVYLDLFKGAGVEAVLAGHYHRNAYGRDGKLEMITTGPVGKPLGRDPSGFRIVKVGKGALEHEYFALQRP